MNAKKKELLRSVKKKIRDLAAKEHLVKTLKKLLEQSSKRKVKEIDNLLLQIDERLAKLQKRVDAAFPPNGKKKKPNLP